VIRSLVWNPAGSQVSSRTSHTDTLQWSVEEGRIGLVVEGGDDLDEVLFRVVKSQAADREIDDFMTVPRSRPG
jgi:hypothetical protein